MYIYYIKLHNHVFSCVFIEIFMKFAGKGFIDDKSTSVQVMAWCWTGIKPLPEAMMTQPCDEYMWHQISVN